MTQKFISYLVFGLILATNPLYSSSLPTPTDQQERMLLLKYSANLFSSKDTTKALELLNAKLEMVEKQLKKLNLKVLFLLQDLLNLQLEPGEIKQQTQNYAFKQLSWLENQLLYLTEWEKKGVFKHVVHKIRQHLNAIETAASQPAEFIAKVYQQKIYSSAYFSKLRLRFLSDFEKLQSLKLHNSDATAEEQSLLKLAIALKLAIMTVKTLNSKPTPPTTDFLEKLYKYLKECLL